MFLTPVLQVTHNYGSKLPYYGSACRPSKNLPRASPDEYTVGPPAGKSDLRILAPIH